jgi:V-type H+-transporting ATPase subunit D
MYVCIDVHTHTHTHACTYTQETVRYIATELDELEREEFVRLKKVQASKKKRVEEENLKMEELERKGLVSSEPTKSMLDVTKDPDDLFS